MKELFLTLCLLPMAVSAAVTETDSMYQGHRVLKELEVVGVKQAHSADFSAVTKITPQMVRNYQITDLNDVSMIAPNFYMPDYGSRMTSSIYVRGLGARIDQPIVGLSVDNVPVMNKDAYDFDVGDIERIDVLRGAQSLLNGRNTMGGQVNIYTLSPWNYQGLRLSASYGRANEVRASLSYLTKYSNSWASSLGVLYRHSDGYFINHSNGKKVDKENSASLRWKLCWRPQQWLSMTNVASASLTRQGGYPYESLDRGFVEYGDTCFYRRTTFSDGLTVAWAGKRVVVTSVTTVQYIDDNMTLDQDFLIDDYFTLTQKRHEWSFTEDLFTKGTRGNYDWLGGVFAFTKSGHMDAPVTFLNTGISRLIEQHRNQVNPSYPIGWDTRNFVLGSNFRQSSRGIAFYHQSAYKFGRWHIQAGLRLDIERVGLRHRSECATGYTTYNRDDSGKLTPYSHTDVNIDDGGECHKTYVELLPKIAASYNIGNWEIYTNISKAYKAGGFNTQMFSDVLQQRLMQFMGMSMSYKLEDIVSYKPEKSMNYELGVRTQHLDGRLSADVTAFYIDCRDQQLTMFPPGVTTGRIMTNAGRTHSYGAELSSSWRPNDNLLLTLAYGYTHATFSSFSDSKGDYKGKHLPYTPSHTLFGSVDYSLPFTIIGARPSLNVNVRGAGDIYWDEANTVKQPFYATVGASASLAFNKWSLRLWGENLTSTRYSTFYFVSIGNKFVQRARPWRIGATIRLNFQS